MMRAAGLRWICEHCGAAFARQKTGDRPIRFCAQACYHGWRDANDITTGQFKPGQPPWNAGVKGLHHSPATQFKKGIIPQNKLPVGSVTLRTFKRGTPRYFVKVAEPNVWLEQAIVVWERENGSVPDGYVVHHKDRNSMNDDPSNLEALTRQEHIDVHRDDLVEAQYGVTSYHVATTEAAAE